MGGRSYSSSEIPSVYSKASDHWTNADNVDKWDICNICRLVQKATTVALVYSKTSGNNLEIEENNYAKLTSNIGENSIDETDVPKMVRRMALKDRQTGTAMIRKLWMLISVWEIIVMTVIMTVWMEHLKTIVVGIKNCVGIENKVKDRWNV